MTNDDLDYYKKDSSCAIWIPSCYLLWEYFYIAVEPIEQYAIDHPITYSLEFEQTKDFILLQTDSHQQSSFVGGNWDYDFYYSISSEVSSMRWRVRVMSGEGVLVTVRNHRCPLQATWTKQIWCDADYYDQPWMCDIEIGTRAQHPGDNAFFVSVYGKNAEYSIAFWRGLENCHFMDGKFRVKGEAEGADFCVGFLRYEIWRWDDYSRLDNEARCFFASLARSILADDDKCDSGIPLQCGFALRGFSCFELFRRCDEQGFYTGVCRDSCSAVEYECRNHFETLNLEHFNCSSSRYTDFYHETCTGGAFLFAESILEVEDPDQLRFQSSPQEALVDVDKIGIIDAINLRDKFAPELGTGTFFDEFLFGESPALSVSFTLLICILALLI